MDSFVRLPDLEIPPILENSAMKASEKFENSLSTRLFLMSPRGVENVHIYLWILKDIFWALGYVYAGSTFGCAALAWTAFLFFNALKARVTEELYFLVPMFLWLFGNFWWMRTEFIDNKNTISGREQGGYIMLTGMIFAQLYYIIFKWTGWLKSDEFAVSRYIRNGYVPYFKCFENWRKYEFFHIVCWIGKDIGWNFKLKYLWVICVFLTVIVSLDFIRVSAKSKKNAVDLTHYITQFVWLCANIVWSAGEIFELTSDDTHSIFIADPITCR